MAINKVIYGDDTLIDLTEDTVSASNLLSGETAHDRSGATIQGTVTVPDELNDLDDVNISSVTGGQALVYDSTSSKWVNGDVATSTDITNAINALDGGTIGTPSASKTVTALSESNGNVSATFEDIQIAESQVTNLTTDLGKKANLASPTFTGTPKAPTAALGTDSTQIATTAFVQDAIEALPEPMVFKGSLGTGGTITTLPVDGSASRGDTYKVITDGTYASQPAKVGDTFICDSKTSSANTWTHIPSGDEPSGTVTSITIKATSPIAVNSSSAITTSGTRTISHEVSGVTAGTYKSVTVDDKGHVTAGSNPTTIAGYGITDAKITNGTITLGSNTITPVQDANYVHTDNNYTTTEKNKLAGIESGAQVNPAFATGSTFGSIQVGSTDVVAQFKPTAVTTTGTNLNDYKTAGQFYFSSSYTPTNIPVGSNGILIVIPFGNNGVKQIWARQGTPGTNDHQTYIRMTSNGTDWGAWKRFAVTDDIPDELNDLTDVAISSAINGQGLIYNSTSSKWENSNLDYVNYEEQNFSGSKNLIPYPYVSGSSVTTENVTYTNSEEGWIYLNSTLAASDTANYNLANPTFIMSKIKGNKYYTFSLERDDDNIYGLVYFSDASGNNVSYEYDAIYEDGTTKTVTAGYVSLNYGTLHSKVTFKIHSDDEFYVKITLRVPSGAGPFNNKKVRAMLRIGANSDDTWAPWAMTNKQLTDSKAGTNAVVNIVHNGSTSNTFTATRADGTTFQFEQKDYNVVPSVFCTTGATSAAKTGSCDSFKLKNPCHFQIVMANDNTKKSKLTLNINSTGAKDIWIDGAVSSSSNYTLPGGTYFVYYDGKYNFYTDGSFKANNVIVPQGGWELIETPTSSSQTLYEISADTYSELRFVVNTTFTNPDLTSTNPRRITIPINVFDIGNTAVEYCGQIYDNSSHYARFWVHIYISSSTIYYSVSERYQYSAPIAIFTDWKVYGKR